MREVPGPRDRLERAERKRGAKSAPVRFGPVSQPQGVEPASVRAVQPSRAGSMRRPGIGAAARALRRDRDVVGHSVSRLPTRIGERPVEVPSSMAKMSRMSRVAIAHRRRPDCRARTRHSGGRMTRVPRSGRAKRRDEGIAQSSASIRLNRRRRDPPSASGRSERRNPMGWGDSRPPSASIAADGSRPIWGAGNRRPCRDQSDNAPLMTMVDGAPSSRSCKLLDISWHRLAPRWLIGIGR